MSKSSWLKVKVNFKVKVKVADSKAKRSKMNVFNPFPTPNANFETRLI